MIRGRLYFSIQRHSVSFGGIDEGLGFISFIGHDIKDGSFNTIESIKSVEELVLVGNLFDGWDGVKFLLDISDGSDALSHEWDFLLKDVFLNFIEGLFLSGGDLEWDKDLSRVALEELSDVWLLNGDGVWDLFPLGLLEDVLNLVGFLFVLSDSNLAGDDVWNLLDDSVVNSLS